MYFAIHFGAVALLGICLNVSGQFDPYGNVPRPTPSRRPSAWWENERNLTAEHIMTEAWITRGGYQYRVSNHKEHCLIAQEECQRELGYLAVVTNTDENNFLANLTTNAYFGYWKKLHDLPNVWTWMDGGNSHYTNWPGNNAPIGLAQTDCYCSFIADDKTWRYDNCMRPDTPTGNFAGHYFVCQRPQNFCTATACKNGGSCVQSGTNFKCSCVSGTAGRLCENVTQLCSDHPCQHRGVCFNKLGHFECECEPGFAGATCEIDINECDSHPCNNGGSCVDLENGYECQCNPQANGSHCEQVMQMEVASAQFQGPHKVNVAAIVVPIVLGCLFIFVSVIVILFFLHRRKSGGGRAYTDHLDRANQTTELPEARHLNKPAVQNINTAPAIYHDEPPPVNGANPLPDAPQPDQQQPPVHGHYNDQPRFEPTAVSRGAPPLPALKANAPMLATISPYYRSASPMGKPAAPYVWPTTSPLEKTTSPLLLPDIFRSARPVSRQSTLSSGASSPLAESTPVNPDIPMLYTRQGSRPKPTERPKPVDSHSTPARMAVEPASPSPAKRKKSPRPKSIEDMMERKDRDTSDSDHSSMSTTRPVNAISGGTNELTLGYSNPSNGPLNRPNFNMAKPVIGYIPMTQPKASILKKPKAFFPSIHETAMNSRVSGSKSPEMKFQSPIYTGEKSPEMKFPTATYAGEKSPEMKFPSPMYAGLTGGGAGIRKAVI